MLLALLEHNRQELSFWRERNWSALKNAVLAMGALASATLLNATSSPLTPSFVTGFVVPAVVFIIALMHHLYQRKNVKTYDALKLERESILSALVHRL